MLNEEKITDIHEFIINGQLDDALQHIEELDTGGSTQVVIILRMRIRQLEKSTHLGILDTASADLERNKIVAAILNLIKNLKAKDDKKNEPNNIQTEIAFFEEILDLLEMTGVAFQAQTRQRKRLVQMLKDRIEELTYDNIPELLFTQFHSMKANEKRLHGVIRGYTELIRKNNLKTLQLLENNPKLLSKVEKMSYLKKHLAVWNSKYESIFSDPSVCLIYVGVDERLRFPIGIEGAVRGYLAELGKE